MPLYIAENGNLKKSNLIDPLGGPFSPAHAQLRSEEVQELLSKPPGWMVRWGITVIFALIAVLFMLSWIVKYPDVIPAKVTLTSPEPPASIVAHSTGKIDQLLVQAHQPAKAGQVLAILENPATYADVMALQDVLRSVNSAALSTEANAIAAITDKDLHLGELQGDFSALVQSYHDYAFFVETDYHAQSIAAIEQQIQSYQQLRRTLNDQTSLSKRDLSLTQKRFSTDSLLHSGQVIADVDLETSESTLLQKKNTYLQTNTSRINSDIQLSELRKTVMDLRIEAREQSDKLLTALQQNIARLESQLKTWEQKYVLRSPIAGKVSFHKFRAVHQHVKAGDEVMTVVPDETQLFCTAHLPVAGAGKVKTGQRVLVKFDHFPYQEYGYVTGKVTTISLLPRDSSYVIGIDLPEGLQTNYGKGLAFRQEMQGSAEVITDDLRVAERFFYQLRKGFTKE